MKTNEIINVNVDEEVNKMFEHIRRKKAVSQTVFITLNVSIFCLSASLIILNLFSVRWSPANEDTTKWLFVVLSILVALSTFVTSLLSIFVYRRKSQEKSEKIEAIKREKKKFQNKEDVYSGTAREAEIKLIEKLNEILNIELH